jgi:hypothetical protein
MVVVDKQVSPFCLTFLHNWSKARNVLARHEKDSGGHNGRCFIVNLTSQPFCKSLDRLTDNFNQLNNSLFSVNFELPVQGMELPICGYNFGSGLEVQRRHPGYNQHVSIGLFAVASLWVTIQLPKEVSQDLESPKNSFPFVINFLADQLFIILISLKCNIRPGLMTMACKQ